MRQLEKDLREKYKEEYEKEMWSTVVIAEKIAYLAHDGQKRLDGTRYILHPMSLADHYRMYAELDNNNFDEDYLYQFDIPYTGILELCWLHDVVEDSKYSEEDIADVYNNLGYGRYYQSFISLPLKLITHDKSEAYPIYIDKVCQNINSALVKFLDLMDNSNPITLDHLGDKELKRLQDYASYIKTINDRYHFIENFNTYYKMRRLYDLMETK